MLAEIAMANAAFGVIKSAIANGRELAQCGKSISDFLSAEDSLKDKTEIDKKSVFNKIMGKDTNDFESFLALDQIKEQRRQLESHMRLYGRPGLYDSWVEYQGQVRKARKEAEKQRIKERVRPDQQQLPRRGRSVVARCHPGGSGWHDRLRVRHLHQRVEHQ